MGKKRNDQERYGSPYGRHSYTTGSIKSLPEISAEMIEGRGEAVGPKTAKQSDDAAALEARGLKIVEPGYQLIAKVLREKLGELNALLALATAAGLDIEISGVRGASLEERAMEEFSRAFWGGMLITPKDIRRAPQLEIAITRRERL